MNFFSSILRPRRSARGVTLLETILAAALLAGVAGAIVSALAGMASSEDKRRLRLAGYEVANRLLLQFADDSSAMPDASMPYEYQPGVFFRYTLDKLPLKLEIPTDSVMEPSGWGAADASLKQLLLLDVRVFVSNERGDFIQPIAQLTRCHHPWPLYSSNPDARRRWFDDPRNVASITSAFMEAVAPTSGSSGGTRPTTPGTGGTGGPRTPRGSTSPTSPGSSGGSITPGTGGGR